MGAGFKLEFRNSYIHLQHDPGYEITPENLKELFSQLTEACKKYKCKHVLSEGKISVRKMKAINAYESGEQFSNSIFGLAMACVFDGYTTDNITEFFKTVATNRGARVEFFSTRAEALTWLGVDEE